MRTQILMSLLLASMGLVLGVAGGATAAICTAGTVDDPGPHCDGQVSKCDLWTDTEGTDVLFDVSCTVGCELGLTNEDGRIERTGNYKECVGYDCTTVQDCDWPPKE